MEGTIKWYNVRKGYGFVKGEDGEDYFVHHTSLGSGVFLRENDLVSFEPAETEKGKQAQSVELLKKGSERDDVESSADVAEEVEGTEAKEFEGEEESSEEAPAEEAPEEKAEEEAPAEEEAEEKAEEKAEEEAEEKEE